jgi:hypothetical protein
VLPLVSYATCHRHPGGFNRAYSLVCLHCQRPSPCNSKVGSCNYFFRGLLSVHSRYGLHARGVAKRPFTPKAPTAPLPRLPFRLLPGGANQFPGGSCTRWSPAPFTAHCYANYDDEAGASPPSAQSAVQSLHLFVVLHIGRCFDARCVCCTSAYRNHGVRVRCIGPHEVRLRGISITGIR